MKHQYTATDGEITLCPLSLEDSENYRQLRNLDENRTHFFYTGIIDAKSQQKWYEKYLETENDYMFAIHHKDMGFIGGIALYNFEEDVCELGRFLIDREKAGHKGYGTRAELLLLEIAKKKLRISRIHCDIFADNQASLGLHYKNGFVAKHRIPATDQLKERVYVEKSLVDVVLVTSTYNGAPYLPKLLHSLSNQTYSHFTLFVRDDGSKDSTVELLRRYQKQFEEEAQGRKIHLLNDDDNDWNNRGSHQSYRYLISKLPQADYYLFCDQDDVWEPDKIEHAIRFMRPVPDDVPVLYVHNYYICDQNLTPLSTLPSRPSISHGEMEKVNLANVIMTGTWGGVGMAQAFNRKLFQLTFQCGDVTPSVAVDCWISWVVAGMNGTLVYDEKPLAYYRRHPGTFSSGDQNGLIRYRDWFRHMDRHCSNIVNGIRDYHRIYGEMVSPDRKRFLELFDSKRRIAKAFYPHRLRNRLMDEIAFRILALMGKI